MLRVLVVGMLLGVVAGCGPTQQGPRIGELRFDDTEVGGRRERAMLIAVADPDVPIGITGPFEVARRFRSGSGEVGVLVAFRPASLGIHSGELVLRTDSEQVRIALSGNAVPCAAKNICHAEDPASGACVPVNEGTGCDAGTIGSCVAGVCTQTPPAEGVACQSPCGFAGTYRNGNCELGPRPEPLVPPSREYKFGYRDAFEHAGGGHFLGHSYLMGPPHESARLIGPAGVETPLSEGTELGQQIVSDAVISTRLDHETWAIERFDLQSGTRIYKLEGTKQYRRGAGSAVADGAVLFMREDGSYASETRAYDLVTGVPIWTQPGWGTALGSVVCLNRGADQPLACVDSRSGTRLFETSGQMVPVGEDAGVLVFGGATSSGDPVLEGRSRSGELLWSRPVSSVAQPFTKHAGVLYFGDGTRLQVADGQALPPIPVPTGDWDSHYWRLAFGDGRAYAANVDPLCAIDLATGSTDWCLPKLGVRPNSVSARSDGVRYAIADQNKGLYLCHVGLDGSPISSFGFPTLEDYGAVAFGVDRAIVGWYPRDDTGSWTLQTELLPITP